MTVEGRSKDTTVAIDESDANLGVESTKDWLDGYTPTFVDFPFTDDDAEFSDHYEVVAEVQPEVAVAPDIEKGRTLESVVAKADRLLAHATNVIVVPKSVHPERVPDRFRVGVPLADYGSGAPWGAFAYRRCDSLHLLGGGPSRQLTAAKSLPATVDSVDTASLGKCSRFGYWDGRSTDAPDEWDYRRRLKESLDNYAAVWADR